MIQTEDSDTQIPLESLFVTNNTIVPNDPTSRVRRVTTEDGMARTASTLYDDAVSDVNSLQSCSYDAQVQLPNSTSEEIGSVLELEKQNN